ncbi:MAG: GNAT family N-acetyltransferase [Campylobacteraceae bacterium]
MKKQDINTLSKIWLDASLKAHDFISKQYWLENKILMEEKYLPNAEVYIALNEDEIYGFVALVENHLASIFVCNEHQGKGIGSLLLRHVKELRLKLTLNVYQKNTNSIGFYRSNNFEIIAESIDESIGEKEFIMQWKK